MTTSDSRTDARQAAHGIWWRPAWVTKVNQMSDGQVIAVYNKLNERKYFAS